MTALYVGAAQREFSDPRLRTRYTGDDIRITVIPPPSDAPGSDTVVHNVMDRKLHAEVQALVQEAGEINQVIRILKEIREYGTHAGFDRMEQAVVKANARVNYLRKMAQKLDVEQSQYDSCGDQDQPCSSAPNSRHSR